MGDSASLTAWDSSASSLSPVQLAAAELIGRGKTRSEAAALVGVDRTSVQRWVNNPEFQQAIAEANREWRAEFAARASRIVELALEHEERNLGPGTQLSKDDIIRLAHEIVVRTQFS